MARKMKDSQVYARVPKDFRAVVDEYVTAVDMDMADLVRVAIEEYIRNHPIKKESV